MAASTQVGDKRRRRFPKGILTTSLVVTMGATLGLSWCAWDSYESLKKLQQQEFRLQELVGEVRHLDEVLTMSTHMGASTGGLHWEERYLRFEPILSAAIKEMLEIAPEVHALEGVRRTDAANDRLVGIEYQAFDLLRQGRAEEASALLRSEEYETQKHAYEKGMEDSLAAVQAHLKLALDSRRRRAHRAVAAVGVVLPVMLFCWLYTLRTLRLYVGARGRAEAALQTAHAELEQRIEERTADLVDANKRLQEEIAERRRIEATLRESEEQHRAFFEQAPDSIVQVDPTTGVLVRFNDRAHENLGYTREEFRNLTIADLEAVESPEEVALHIENILNTGSDTFETKHRRKDGEIRDVLVNSRIVFVHGQRLFQSIWTDITERQRTLEALWDSTRELAALAEERQTLLKHTRDFVYRHDTQGVFNYLSPSIEQITGRTVEEWRRHYSAYMTDNPINQKVYAYTEETLRTGKASPPYLVEITHKDGRLIMLEVNEQAYFDKGKVAGIVGVARDVTDRIRAEEALRASEHQLQGILDNSTAVIYVKGLDGRYILANHRFEELFHIPQDKLVGKSDYDLFPKDRADAFTANDKRVLEECRPVEFEETVPHNDEVHTYISLKFPLYDSNDRPYAVCGISTDITDRQQARQALQEAKEAAESASKAKSTFLANMSHEIRTPIMAMLGVAELMSRSDADHLDPKRLDAILRSGRHLLSLVEDLLDLSRAEQGKLEVRHTPCSPLEIMADVEAVVAPLHCGRGIDFQVFYDTAIPSMIRTDPTRLKQAVINLISNALKFTDTGHVFVRLRADRDVPDPRLSISVEDTGRGIPSSKLESVFDIFTQLDREGPTVSMGLGLGLPLAKWIAEKLGGALDATSIVGEGSTFTMRIATGPVGDVEWVTPDEATKASWPTPTGRPTSQPHAKEKAEPLFYGRVLLAEDASDLRELIADVLAGAGVDVTTVSDGEEAVNAAVNGSFDLILMDVRMPKMSGSDATAELRRRECLTPIIALTASAAPDDRRRILDAGFDDLWAKPISMDRIIDGVADYLCRIPDAKLWEANGGATRHVDSSSMESVVANFLESLVPRTQALRDALAASDTDRARGILHQLVGTAGTLGFMSVSREAGLVMSKVMDGSFAHDPQVLKPLEDLIHRISRSRPEGDNVGMPSDGSQQRVV